jgi:hypothetical protein
MVTVDNESPPFIVDSSTPNDSTSIKVDEPRIIGANTAKSTSFEEPLATGNGDSKLKPRNTTAVERSVTPTSIHSALKDPKQSKGFFQALFQTIFGWIGGLISGVFGSKRGA